MNFKPLKIQPESKRSLSDLAVIFVTAILSFALALILDAFGSLTRWTGREIWQIDELYFLFVILLFGFGLFSLLGIFSMRRWIQLQQELKRRKQAEEALQKTHDELELRVAERTSELSRANAQLKAEIAEREQVEAALRESEELFRQVVSSISDHIYVTEIKRDGTRLNRYLSHHAAQLTGYPLEKLLNDWSLWPSTLIHPKDRAAAAEQAAQLAKGINSEVEYRLIRADGETVWVRDSARTQQIDDSAYIVYGVVSDITERKRAEREIRELNQELEKRVIDRTRKLAALYEVTAVANKSLELKLTLKLSLERLLNAMRIAAGAIHLLDEQDETTLSLATEQGLLPNMVASLGALPSDQGLAGLVIEQNKPVLIADLETDPQTPPAIRGSQFNTYVGVPIRARGQALGVLSILGRSKNQFNEGEVALLTSIADQVGVAVENIRLQKQAQQAAVMRERARLARELHDAVTQSLYSLTLFAEAASELIESGNLGAVKHNLRRIGETALQALKEMRLLVYELRPSALERDGLVGALRERLNAVEGRVNVRARLITEDLIELPAPVEEGLYRIAQEALNNILKHAAASSVALYLRANGNRVELEVIDDGTGFDLAQAEKAGGMGLKNIRERARKIGGSVEINTGPGQGTKIIVTANAQGRPN